MTSKCTTKYTSKDTVLTKPGKSVIQSGCRDKAPSPGVLKSISYRQRIRSRRHNNETLSLLKMVEDKKDGPDEVLPKIILHPKGGLGLGLLKELVKFTLTAVLVFMDTGLGLQGQKGADPFSNAEVTACLVIVL